MSTLQIVILIIYIDTQGQMNIIIYCNHSNFERLNRVYSANDIRIILILS